MAFSFRIGTKWCHDFPKLARESGFYFNMHKSRIRVDWNRISNIDIDRIIRERDFHTIDDHINSVIDYCLESEYDVKILDPNFVKLFRLAQLAVEYLLYCKQYLDHSVVILKDELRSKIEENVKLKREVATLEDTIKHLKEKSKDRSKLIETKIGDCNGEIYKCPYCSKTFISSTFVSAHIIRRHAYTPDLCVTSSPAHEHYRNETEKLHNEIKSLKERLNETERVIRTDSEKIPDKKNVDCGRRLSEADVGSFKYDTNKTEEHQEYKGYQEEIKNLKTMLFDEIHNLRQKEKTMYERTSETNVLALMNQQEKEFQKLRTQLFEKLTPNIENMHAKLYAQEDYWKSKIERLEEQHQKDIERLTTELKLTQKVADDMKSEYESKVNNLERETANQSNILIEQDKRLHSLSHEINVSLLNEKNKTLESTSQKNNDQFHMLDQSSGTVNNPNESDLKQRNTVQEHLSVDSISKAITPDVSLSKVLPLTLKHKISRNVHTMKSARKTVINDNTQSTKHENTKIAKNTKVENEKNVERELKCCSLSNTSESQDSFSERELNHEMKHKKYDFTDQVLDANEAAMNKLENIFSNTLSQRFLSTNSNKEQKAVEDDLISETNSESVISESQTHSETESITIIHNNSPIHESKKTGQHSSFYKKLQKNLRDIFEQKLRDLGIDPEWQGIPKQTFRQKMDILKHHQKITTKKLPKYHQIKSKVIEEVLNKISKREKVMENSKPIKKSVAIKAFGDRRNSSDYISTLQTQDAILNKVYSTPERHNYIKNKDDHNSMSVKVTKTSNHKRIENLMQIPSNSITSLDDVRRSINSQETSLRRDSLSKMKSLFGSNNAHDSNIHNVSMSPKYNKSVLKSATGSTGSLTKKKVIFDLAEEKNEESLSGSYIKKEDLNDNWNTSSTSNEKKHLSERESYKNTSNIVLKTTQSDKIAEISKKLEIQLNMARQKPVGSVEAMFPPKHTQDTENHISEQLSSTSISSLLESSLKALTFNSKVTNDTLPQPAPRNLSDKTPEILRTESISEISDLDSDLDKILKLE